MTESKLQIVVALQSTGLRKLFSESRPDGEAVFSSNTLADLVDGSSLSLMAIDPATSETVGFLALSRAAAPAPGAGDARSDLLAWARDELRAIGAEEPSVAWLQYIVTAPGHEGRATRALLQRALVLAPHVRSLAVVSPAKLDHPSYASLASLATVISRRDAGAHLYEIPRDALVPLVTVRRAREEDHDDLLPVLSLGARECPPLAQLPVEELEAEYALARLIARQDEENCILVAEVGGSLVGVAALTSVLDTAPLIGAFDLHSHDGLATPEAYEELYNRAAQLAKQRLLEEIIEDAASRGEDPDPESLSTPPTPAIIRAVMAEMVADPEEAERLPLNSFAASIFCISPGYDFVLQDVLRSAFAAYPGKAYCLVSLPHNAPQPRCLAPFTRIPPLPGVAFPDLLFVFHRDAMAGPLRTRAGRAADLPGVEALLEGAEGSEGVLDSFKEALEAAEAAPPSRPSPYCTVTVCDGEVVAAAVVGPVPDPTAVSAHFRLSSLTDTAAQPQGAFGLLKCHVVNPVFAHRAADIMVDVCAVVGRRQLLYAYTPGGDPPDFLSLMLQVPGRTRSYAGSQPAAEAGARDEGPAHALFIFTPRLAHMPRRQVNHRIVFVGASTSALATIEALLACPTVSFNSLAIVSDRGVQPSPLPGADGRYSASDLARTGASGRVAVLYGAMAGLDRKNQEILLESGEAIPYDVAVLATGLSDSETRRLREAAGDEAAARLVSGWEGAEQALASDPDLIGQINRPPSGKGKAAGSGGDIAGGVVVYGSGPEALEAVAGLVEAGVAADRIAIVRSRTESFVTVALEAAAQTALPLPVRRLDPPPGSVEPSVVRVGEVRPSSLGPSGEAELLQVRFDQVPVASGPGQAGLVSFTHRCALLVVCDREDVHRGTFSAVNNNGLVFHGRVVVDGAFRTNDPRVLAVGPCARLSRGARPGYLTAGSADLEFADKREIGEALARSIVLTFETSHGAGPAASEEEAPLPLDNAPRAPLLLKPAAREALLPGVPGSGVLYAATPPSMARPTLRPGPGSRIVRGVVPGRSATYLCLTRAGAIEWVCYCGAYGPETARKLCALVGMHSSYFGGLLDGEPDADSGVVDVPTLAAALQDSLFAAYFNEGFTDVRRRLLKAAIAAPEVSKPGPGVAPPAEAVPGWDVREALLEFLRVEGPGMTAAGSGAYCVVPQPSVGVMR